MRQGRFVSWRRLLSVLVRRVVLDPRAVTRYAI
jgi:hypothetical protein